MNIFQKLFGRAGQWDTVLSKCDLCMARDGITDMHRLQDAEAAKQGGNIYYKKEYTDTWKAFRDNPTADNARLLLDVAPPLARYFEACSPGGRLYEINRLLKL